MVAQIATEDAVAGRRGVVLRRLRLSRDGDRRVAPFAARALFRRQVLDDDSRALLRQYSPLYQAHKNMPPLLLINGTGERLWAQAQAFARG